LLTTTQILNDACTRDQFAVVQAR